MTRRVILFYILTWFFIMLIGGVQQAIGVIPAEFGLPQWGPGLAGLLMVALFKKDGLKISWFSKKLPLTKYLQVVLVPLGIALVVFVIKSLIKIPAGEGAYPGNLWLIILWAPLGALGEEIGWRGYLNKLLDTRMRGIFSALLVGLLWMPIHIQFLSKGFPFILIFLLLVISYSIVVYGLIQDTRFNVLAATLFHLTINYTNLLFLDVIYETKFMLVNAVVWVIAAMIMVKIRKEIYFKS